MITYGRMRHDLQIKAVLSAYKLPILRATWALDPEGCRDEVVQHVADDLGLPVMGAEGDPPGPARRRGIIWHRHLSQALQKLTYGHMIFERRYEVQPDGYVQLASLGPRMPWTVAHVRAARSGEITEIVQTTQLEPLNASRLVWYVTELEGSNWMGVSPLRSAFGAWLLKHEAWRVHASSIRRFGMGIPVVEAPPGATETQVAQAQQMASAMRGGDQAGIGMPQGFKAVMVGQSGHIPDAMAFIQYLDRAIAKSALAGLIELGQTETGSRALGETFLDLFLLSLQAVADDIATTATSGWPGMPGIVTDLVDQNWGEDEPAPRIVCTDVGESYDVSADAITSLVTSKALTPDKNLEDWLRKTWRLPVKGGPSNIPPPPKPVPPAPPASPPPAQPPPGGAPNPPPPPPKPAGGRPATPPKASAPMRREGECGFNAAAHQQQWQAALDGLVSSYRDTAASQRVHLVDQVQAATRPVALNPPPVGDGPQIILDAMTWAARQAAQAVMAEAAVQGVHIDPATVNIDLSALRATATARARLAAAAMAQQATAKALQVQAATPEAGMVAVHLDGLTDQNLREQLGAALTAAQNAGRSAVFAAGPPGASYIATEILDTNTCGPCRGVDGTEFASLTEAEGAYPAGGYEGCLGLARCRGTLMAKWDAGVQAAKFDSALHPRVPGGKGGGEFAKNPFKNGDVVIHQGKEHVIRGTDIRPWRRHLPGQLGDQVVRVEPSSRGGNVKRRGKWLPASQVQLKQPTPKEPSKPKAPPKPGEVVKWKGESLVVQDMTMLPHRHHKPGQGPLVRLEPASRQGNAKNKGVWVPVKDVQPVSRPAPAELRKGLSNLPGEKPKTPAALKPGGFLAPKPKPKQLDKVLQEAIKAKPKPPSAPHAPSEKRKYWWPGEQALVNAEPVIVRQHVGDQVQVRRVADQKLTWVPGAKVEPPGLLKPSAPHAPSGKFKPGDQLAWNARNGKLVEFKETDGQFARVRVKGENADRWVPLLDLKAPNAPATPKPVLRKGDQFDLHGIVVEALRADGKNVVVRDAKGQEHAVPPGWLKPLRPGQKRLPKQKTVPFIHVAVDTPAQAQLRSRWASGGGAKMTANGLAAQGCQASTQKVNLADGSHAVHKSFGPWGEWTPADMASAEELSGLTGAAVGGTNVKAVIRVGPDKILMDFAEHAQLGTRFRDVQGRQAMQELANSPTGLRIGVMDIVNDNRDRHGQNWMVADGLPVPIDNSSTHGIPGGGAKGVFREALQGQILDHRSPFTAAEIAAMDGRLRDPALKARYTELGKAGWYKAMIGRWTRLQKEMAAVPPKPKSLPPLPRNKPFAVDRYLAGKNLAIRDVRHAARKQAWDDRLNGRITEEQLQAVFAHIQKEAMRHR